MYWYPAKDRIQLGRVLTRSIVATWQQLIWRAVLARRYLIVARADKNRIMTEPHPLPPIRRPIRRYRRWPSGTPPASIGRTPGRAKSTSTRIGWRRATTGSPSSGRWAAMARPTGTGERYQRARPGSTGRANRSGSSPNPKPRTPGMP